MVATLGRTTQRRVGAQLGAAVTHQAGTTRAQQRDQMLDPRSDRRTGARGDLRSASVRVARRDVRRVIGRPIEWISPSPAREGGGPGVLVRAGQTVEQPRQHEGAGDDEADHDDHGTDAGTAPRPGVDARDQQWVHGVTLLASTARQIGSDRERARQKFFQRFVARCNPSPAGRLARYREVGAPSSISGSTQGSAALVSCASSSSWSPG